MGEIVCVVTEIQGNQLSVLKTDKHFFKCLSLWNTYWNIYRLNDMMSGLCFEITQGVHNRQSSWNKISYIVVTEAWWWVNQVHSVVLCTIAYVGNISKYKVKKIERLKVREYMQRI